MKEIITFKQYKEIREAVKLPINDKCSKCGKKFKDNSKMYPVQHGDNYKFICSSCNGGEEDADRTIHKVDIAKEESDTTRPSEQNESIKVSEQ